MYVVRDPFQVQAFWGNTIHDTYRDKVSLLDSVKSCGVTH